MPTKVSLQQIARAAGCSIATVSRALRNHPRLAQATCERVQTVARELGYVPDARLRELMVHLRKGKELVDRPVLACVLDIPLPGEEEWRRYDTQASYMTGAFHRAETIGYRLEFFSLREKGVTPARLSRILYHRGISGVLVGAMQDPTTRLDLRWEWFTAVAIGHSLAAPILHRVSSHQFHSIRMCYRRARERGYGRIGMVMMPKIDRRTDYNLRAAFLTEQSLDPGDGAVPLLMAEISGEESFRDWFRRHRPDVILYAGTNLNVPRWVEAMGLRVPEEIGLMSPGIRFPELGESGCNEQMDEVGAAAVELLVSEMVHHRRGIPEYPKLLLLEGIWQEGRTLRPVAP